MYRHIYTIFNDTEISHTPIDKKGNVTIHCETPDANICFKTFEYKIPINMKVSNLGYSDDEIGMLTHFIQKKSEEIMGSAMKLNSELLSVK